MRNEKIQPKAIVDYNSYKGGVDLNDKVDLTVLLEFNFAYQVSVDAYVYVYVSCLSTAIALEWITTISTCQINGLVLISFYYFQSSIFVDNTTLFFR